MTTINQKFMKGIGMQYQPKGKVRRRVNRKGIVHLDRIRRHHSDNLARAQKRIGFRTEAARQLKEQHTKKQKSQARTLTGASLPN